MIIKEKTFKAWMDANLGPGEQRELARRGADAEWPGLSHTKDCAELFDKFDEEIWALAVQDAEDLGHRNVAELIAGFKRADMLGSIDGFKNLMVWYAAERYARQRAGAR